MPLKTKPFDAAKHFRDEASRAELLRDAIESGHAGYIATAEAVVAKARAGDQPAPMPAKG